MRRLSGLLLAAAVLLTAVLGLGRVRPQADVAAAEAVAVAGASVVCPGLPDVTTPSGTRVTVGTPTPAAAGTTGSSAVTSRDLSGAPAALALRATGTVTALGADRAAPVVLAARGALAGGLRAEQLTTGSTGAGLGYQGLVCTGPQADSWFAGGSTASGASTVLVLTDPDSTDAVVDVDVWSAAGPVDPRPGRGLAVPARGRTVVRLDELAPAAGGLAVHVSVSRGRVAAAVQHVRGDAATPGGAEWVPPTAPAERVLLAGLPAGPGERTLLVTNPGLDPTVVAVQLTSGDGQFVPAGLDAVPVPAGTTVPVDLTALLAAAPAAVTVTSADGPVLAVGLAVDGAGAGEDLAYAGAVAALAGPALVPSVPGSGSVLLLSAPLGDARVLLSQVPQVGAATAVAPPRTVDVPGGSTVAVPLSGLGLVGAEPALQVTPGSGSGPVLGDVLLRADTSDGTSTALLPLLPSTPTVSRPAVAGDLGAALP